MSLQTVTSCLDQDDSSNTKLPLIGVGLRHQHYNDALSFPADIDFVEIHAENFFAEGGISQALLCDIQQQYDISLHATSLGLGSVQAIPSEHISKFSQLVKQLNPLLISDHASFSWGQLGDIQVHAGDLLPVPFNEESLAVMSKNIDTIQRTLGRTILVENLSAYIMPAGSTMSETEFLVRLCENTDCQLLVDLNNLMVNAVNQQDHEPLMQATTWLNSIPKHIVGEIHLAGCSSVNQGELVIDDHSQPVSDDVWTLFHSAIIRFGPIPTLIEWDLDLPNWTTLVAEAEKAKTIASKVLVCR
ncbi:DUF692 domain-containing protein [Thalassotalea atypica]|uniref:DUF692 domain-containing protein n=1 Tax=Thalassotalea atypica TaxID=2054316 RepID=UPI002573461C|nr:DUF692 domain-containing protein [Thalassotalea atypica]